MSDNELDSIYGGGNAPDKVLPIDATPSPDEGFEGYGVARDSNPPNMCEIRLKNGEGVYIPYHFIQEINYLLDKTLSILTPNCVIEIQGAKLNELRRRLARHEIEWISEGKASPDGVQISKITIHTSGDTLSIEQQSS